MGRTHLKLFLAFVGEVEPILLTLIVVDIDSLLGMFFRTGVVVILVSATFSNMDEKMKETLSDAFSP